MKYDYFEVLHLKEKLQKLYGEEIYKKYEEDFKNIFVQLNDVFNHYFSVDTKMPNYTEDDNSIYNDNIRLFIDTFVVDDFHYYILRLYTLYDNNLIVDTFSRNSEYESFLIRFIYNDIDKLNYSNIKDLTNFLRQNDYIQADKIEIYKCGKGIFEYKCDGIILYSSPITFKENNDFANLFLSMRDNEQYFVDRPKIYQKLIDNHNIK